MLLGGLWHGASLNFVVWGGIHGACRSRSSAPAGAAPCVGWLPAPLQIAVTFGDGVARRGCSSAPPTSATRVRYLAQHAGVASVEPGAALVAGVVHQPYYLLCLALGAGVVWGAPQSWDFTRRLGAARAAWALALLLLSCAMLFAQAYNPFIYFMF